MGEKKKVLGICLAKMQDRVRTEYLNAINRAAAIEGWKIVAYNSFRDFRKNDKSLQGFKSIYKILNYDELDVVIVFPESINNSAVSDDLIESAKQAGKPVICIGPEKEGCYSIIRDYEEAFRDMLNHVINEHGARNLFFVGGFKYDDERNVNRLNIYKSVLEENGIAFDEKKMCYGNYKDEVIAEELDKVFSGNDIPKAIVCIDDKAAITACDKMSEYDLKSPNDIIVTGFGGIPAAYYYHPSITSCSDDVEEFAKRVIQAAKDAMNGEEPKVYQDKFKARIRRSCGCNMRSYMSAGRRSYDLEAAKAAGIYVPEKTADDRDSEAGAHDNIESKSFDNQNNSNPIDSEYDDTVYMPQGEKRNINSSAALRVQDEASLTKSWETNEGPEADNGTSVINADDMNKAGREGSDEPLCDEKSLNEFAASNPKLADTKMGTYDVSYGSGRQVEAQDDRSEPEIPGDLTDNSNEQSSDDSHYQAKIYPSDIFRRAGADKDSIDNAIAEKKETDRENSEKQVKKSVSMSDTMGDIHISPWLGNREHTSEVQRQERLDGMLDVSGNGVEPIENGDSAEKIDQAAKRAMEVAEDKRCIGGHSEERFRSNNHVAYIYKELDEIERREDSLLAWLDKMLEIPDIGDICKEISKRMSGGSVLYIFSELLESNFDIESFENEHYKNENINEQEAFKKLKLTRIIAANDAPNNGEDIFSDEITVNEIIDRYIKCESDGCMLVLNPVFIGDFVCGYFENKTRKVSEIRSMAKLLNVGLNMIFRFLANQNRQQRMMYNIENSIYVSSMTGLPNLKGSTRWFETFAANAENHQKRLSVSVFTMPRYTYIYENYGLNEIEDTVRLVVEKLRSACRKTSFLGQFAEGEYVVIDIEAEADKRGNKERLSAAEQLFDRFSKQMEVYNRSSTKEYYLEVNFGTATVEEGWDSTLENLVRMAMSDLYLRRLRQGKSTPVIRDKTFDREYFTTFELLVDRNLFRYHFQPIVDVSNGEIFAYEALMRTGGGISMTPLDVLEIAKNANRLYDIEKATIFNVLKFYSENLEAFGKRKVFINTLPGYFLNDADRNEAVEKYGKYFDSVVFEVTETDTVNDDEIEKLRRPAPGGETPGVAVDDYGTGHSNIVNLIRYAPQIIKIDRYLISNIQDDSNKQMFVKNTIEFAAANGMKVLAEGVESLEELKKVIEYGVDYVQGFYTARPSAEIMQQIPNNIRNEILSESIKAASFDSENLVYNAKAGETVRLLDLALKKYTVLNILGGKVKLIGEPDNIIDMVIKTADDKKTELIFENVNLRGVLETTVQLGRNSETALAIMGECTLNKDGIYVPAGSRLTVSGDGNLHIITSRNLSIGIGSNCNEPHGDITFDMTGNIKIVANGDKVVGIGGGRCDGSRIRLVNGNFDISAKAIHAVAIGSDIGDTDIYIGRTAKLRLKSDGNDSVALGSISGKSEIICRGKLDVTGDGEKTVGIGSLNGYTKTDLLSNDYSVVLHSYCGIGIGSLTGTADIKLEDATTDIYAEGTQINGIGGGEDQAKVNILGGDLKVEILAGIPRSFGCQKGYTRLHYGSITCLHDTEVNVVNEHHQKIQPRVIENGVVFEV